MALSTSQIRRRIGTHKKELQGFLAKAEKVLALSQEAHHLPQSGKSLKNSSSGIIIQEETIRCCVCKRTIGAPGTSFIDIEKTGMFACSTKCEDIATAAGG